MPFTVSLAVVPSSNPPAAAQTLGTPAAETETTPPENTEYRVELTISNRDAAKRYSDHLRKTYREKVDVRCTAKSETHIGKNDEFIVTIKTTMTVTDLLIPEGSPRTSNCEIKFDSLDEADAWNDTYMLWELTDIGGTLSLAYKWTEDKFYSKVPKSKNAELSSEDEELPIRRSKRGISRHIY
ncbi:hypothetical protein F503_07752 [Ophiostoma piceae UAMH 11346]|uniref:Uncharacterized protein n=1 Tax=Ophiostoma piceae (strain UAMH 11346) TaxID=1262450 RepID=S3C5H9_OPHP1|nr:hypothetical protein F503_07752 [Ophiostoma piceae UAMH 11346]